MNDRARSIQGAVAAALGFTPLEMVQNLCRDASDPDCPLEESHKHLLNAILLALQEWEASPDEMLEALATANRIALERWPSDANVTGNDKRLSTLRTAIATERRGTSN